ncbi:unnamed protein product [Lactuca saligna]|uniref:Uncharacterized protein n=1 Tax=Lactuca saligna TaxID=75948 RepID=A0AA35ZDG1_LACSI|nr:unnamed protein product [Lactuca saligna]
MSPTGYHPLASLTTESPIYHSIEGIGKNHRDPLVAVLVRRSPPGRCYFVVMEPPSVAVILLCRCCFTSSFLLPPFFEAPPLQSGQPLPQPVPIEDRAIVGTSLLSPPFMLSFPL